MAKKQVIFYYDILSPYCYFAHVLMQRYKKRWNLDLIYVPCSLVDIIQGSGNIGPIMGSANKKDYTLKDFLRMSEFYEIEVCDRAFPPDTYGLMQILMEIKRIKPDKLEIITQKMFELIWIKGQSCQNIELISNILTSYFTKIDADSLLMIYGSDIAKRELIDFSYDLVDTKHLFGLPSFVIKKNEKEELIFGSDRMELIAHHLNRTYLGPKNLNFLSFIFAKLGF